MKFTTKMTVEEKKAIYARSIGHMELQLIGMLTQNGIDPDAFDEDAYDPQPVPGQDTIDNGARRILELLADIGRIKTAMETLS
jgi:hypothetical protein